MCHKLCDFSPVLGRHAVASSPVILLQVVGGHCRVLVGSHAFAPSPATLSQVVGYAERHQNQPRDSSHPYMFLPLPQYLPFHRRWWALQSASKPPVTPAPPLPYATSSPTSRDPTPTQPEAAATKSSGLSRGTLARRSPM